MWIATAEHSKRIDRRASDEFGITPSTLIARAGSRVFEAVKEFAPTGAHVAVFCGKGNNGADGFVAARIARDHGYIVDCMVSCTEGELGPMASQEMKVCREQGLNPIFYGDPKWPKKLECITNRDVIVDALLGTGAKGEVQGAIKEAIQAINRSGVPVVSIDVPSGIDCDTGEELGESVWACRTVSMGQAKPCFFQGIGLEHSGFWSVADIGYPQDLLDEPTIAKLIEREWVGSLLPERLRSCYKGENGSLLVVAGSKQMPGAAAMVARAAIRSGIGLLTVAAVPSVCEAVAANVPEAMLIELPEQNGVIAPEAAQLLLERQSSFTGAVFGPGLTHKDPVLEFLAQIWSYWTKCSVIDADALNAVSKGVPLPKTDCVLTPHPGEMSRLLQSSIAEVQNDRFSTIQHAIDHYRQCVLLKGPFTVVGEPNQPILVNCTGNPGMATGGMGDTLSGIIGTLLSQDLPSYYAAACGVHWHGFAADMCACEIGPIGYSATDVANKLPHARVRIVASCESRPPCSSRS